MPRSQQVTHYQIQQQKQKITLLAAIKKMMQIFMSSTRSSSLFLLFFLLIDEILYTKRCFTLCQLNTRLHNWIALVTSKNNIDVYFAKESLIFTRIPQKFSFVFHFLSLVYDSVDILYSLIFINFELNSMLVDIIPFHIFSTKKKIFIHAAQNSTCRNSILSENKTCVGSPLSS